MRFKFMDLSTFVRGFDAHSYRKLTIKGDAANIAVRISGDKYANYIYFRDRITNEHEYTQRLSTDDLIELRDFLNFALPKEANHG